MIGGTIIHIVSACMLGEGEDSDTRVLLIEVLDEQNFDRSWRSIPHPDEWPDRKALPFEERALQLDDSIWWQSCSGYLSRPDSFRDLKVGFCYPVDGPKLSENYYKLR